MAIEEGKAAPYFKLEDQNRKEVALDDLKGKDIIIYFYPKDDTPGCIKEACGFRDIWKEIRNTGAIVLGVSPDDASSHTSFIRKYDLPLTLLSDPDKAK
jgi:peroxiredoxin Q/BCP